ncbi:MAG: aldo/keto reductase [Erysipelotrichales bacterium]|nr:aldo/keto reductase [Erysipelotrichales bacterium]
MKYVTLGKTGLKVSAVGLGGIPIQRTDVEEAKAVVKECCAQGINYLDTARGYTVSEEFFGEALKDVRDSWILASKSMAREYESMKKDIEISLHNLQTDHIELYQIHNIRLEEFDTVFGENGAYKALVEAKEAGKIGHIGATAHSLESFEKLVTEYEDKIETMMFPFNIVENQAERLMKICTEKNIGFIAMKPVAGGNIENVPLGLKYCLNHEDCTMVIPGMGNIEEVKQNCLDTVFDTLTDAEREECAVIRKELGQEFCRRCGYCAPCPQGINIPSNFLFANYLRKYGLAEWAKGRYWSMPKTAKDCIECGTCETRCPYNLPIRAMLKKVAKDME